MPVRPPGEFLLDPSPASPGPAWSQDLARELGAWQIDPMIAFLSTDEQVTTPFARTLRVLESMPWHEKQVARPGCASSASGRPTSAAAASPGTSTGSTAGWTCAATGAPRSC